MQKKTIYARGPEFGSIPEREVRTVSGDLIEEYLLFTSTHIRLLKTSEMKAEANIARDIWIP